MGCLADYVRQREGVMINGQPQPKSGYAADRRYYCERSGARQHNAKSALNRPAMPDQSSHEVHNCAHADRRGAEKSERCEGLFRHARQGGGEGLIFGYSSSDRGARGTNPSRSEE